MAESTKIEWSDSTWPVVQGCDPVSPGCTNCYAVGVLNRLAANPNPKISAPLEGVTEKHKGKLRFTGKVALREDRLDWPLKWKAWPEPRKIFVPSHGDLFHKDVPVDFIDKVFAVMALCRQHTFQVLTKRADRMREYILGNPGIRIRSAMQVIRRSARIDMDWPLPNVWLGVSAEDQQRADERIPDLLATPAAIRFVSAEPLLGPINLSRGGQNSDGTARGGHYWLTERPCEVCKIEDALDQPRGKKSHPINCGWAKDEGRGDGGIDWVICGGESGAGARPMHPDWARLLRDECADAGVPFFFKQWGRWLPWEPEHGPCWVSQNGKSEDRHALFPANMDGDPTWDDGLWAINMGESQAAFQRVGKKAAGALLDGKEHREFPA